MQAGACGGNKYAASNYYSGKPIGDHFPVGQIISIPAFHDFVSANVE
jgi:hypothetical protein